MRKGFKVVRRTKEPDGRFYVQRVDGRDKPGGDRHGADYFVLDLTYDPYALAALLTYSKACRSEYPELAADLEAMGRGIYVKRFVAEIVARAGEEMRDEARDIAESWWDGDADRDDPQPEDDAFTEMSYWDELLG